MNKNKTIYSNCTSFISLCNSDEFKPHSDHCLLYMTDNFKSVHGIK